VSPDRDEPTEEQELYEDVPPRSVFAATWFRVVLVMIVLGVVGAVAVPYALDWMNPPPPRTAATTGVPFSPAPATPALTPAPAFDKPVGDRPAADKTDSTLLPAPATPTPAKPPAEPKSTAKAATPPAKPAPVPAPSEAKGKTAAAITETPVPRRAAVSGPFWVQVGAFKDAETAKRLAAKLRGDNFSVEESTKSGGGRTTAGAAPAPKAVASGFDHYNVFVTGMSVEDLNKRLAGKGLAAEASGDGVLVKPSLPLREAVALSKDLAVEGFKVQVRRAGAAAAADGGPALHRVRVGAFSDQSAALAAVRELEVKGYKPFIARGDQ
jgi:cell division septation protein DedD